MTELVDLYVFLVVLFLLECAEWVPRRAIGLLPLGGRWRARRAFRPNAGWARGVLFGLPWPPLTSPLVAEPSPIVAGPNGLVIEGERPSDGPSFLPWTEVARVSAVGPRVEVNGRPVATFASRCGAAAIARALTGLASLSPGQRTGRLEVLLDARFDATASRARLAVWRKETRAVRLLVNGLWCGLVLGLPLVIWTSFSVAFFPLVGLLLVGWLVAAVLFERTLRRSSWLERDHRPDLARRIVAASSPIAAVRALDLVARELVGDLDPLAAAAPLVSREALAALARPRLVALRLGRDDDLPQAAVPDARWWRAQELARVERLLVGHGVDPAAALEAPPRHGADVVVFCPSCLAQYASGHTHGDACPGEECRGIPLQPFVPPT